VRLRVSPRVMVRVRTVHELWDAALCMQCWLNTVGCHVSNACSLFNWPNFLIFTGSSKMCCGWTDESVSRQGYIKVAGTVMQTGEESVSNTWLHVLSSPPHRAWPSETEPQAAAAAAAVAADWPVLAGFLQVYNQPYTAHLTLLTTAVLTTTQCMQLLAINQPRQQMELSSAEWMQLISWLELKLQHRALRMPSSDCRKSVNGSMQWHCQNRPRTNMTFNLLTQNVVHSM